MPLTVDQIETALRNHGGMIASAARHLGVSRQAIYNRMQTSPRLAEVVAEEREVQIDDAESALKTATRAGEPWAVCFTLKTIGKNRGYVERQEHTGKDGADLVIREVVISEPSARASAD